MTRPLNFEDPDYDDRSFTYVGRLARVDNPKYLTAFGRQQGGARQAVGLLVTIVVAYIPLVLAGLFFTGTTDGDAGFRMFIGVTLTCLVMATTVAVLYFKLRYLTKYAMIALLFGVIFALTLAPYSRL